MKLPEKIRLKVQEKETEIRANKGDGFYEWAVNSETEISNPNQYRSIIHALYEVSD